MTNAERLFIDAQRHFKAEEYEKAFACHLQAAELGYAAAQSNLGYAYLHGKGTAQDYDKAVFWFKKAAAQDNTPAIINLGYCYTKGFGVTEDPQEALNLFARAAMLGSEQGKKHYERLKKQMGMEEPSSEEAPVETPEAAQPTHATDAKKLVRKLIGADYHWLLLVLAILVVTFFTNQLLGDRLPELFHVLSWVIILGGTLVMFVGISSIPGYRNAARCLNRLEELGLLDKAADEIKFGDPQPFGLYGCITESFVYGNGAIFAIDDILWVYPAPERKFTALKMGSRAYPPMTVSGAANNDRKGTLDQAIATLKSRNPAILVGNTSENKKAYQLLRNE